jgi:hypothetical protein
MLVVLYPTAHANNFNILASRLKISVSRPEPEKWKFICAELVRLKLTVASELQSRVVSKEVEHTAASQGSISFVLEQRKEVGMKRVFFLLVTSSFCALNSYSQNQAFSHVFVQAPRDVILTTVAFQPNCPIRFEDARFLVGVGGGGTISYQIRNISSKPIRTVTVTSSHGTTDTFAIDHRKVLANPGQLVPLVSERYLTEFSQCKECPRTRIVPLTPQLRERLNLNPPMRSIVVLMVSKVEFADGTSFEDHTTYEAMTAFMDKIGQMLRVRQQTPIADEQKPVRTGSSLSRKKH